MAAEQNYAKLGLFVVVILVAMLATGLFFVQRLRSREVIPLVTYFTEDVTGLDISSPVRYRGVGVGRVSDVRVHLDGTTIEVQFELFQDRLAEIGENVTRLRREADLPMARRLRARVVGNPVTGEGYLLLDIPRDPPPLPALGFTPSRGYVPSMPSPLAAAQNRLPEVLERAEETFQALTTIVARMPDSLERTDRFFTNVDRTLRESRLAELSADMRTFFTSTTAQIGQIGSNMDQIASDMDRLVGTDGSLIKFAEEARSAIREADLSTSTKAALDAADRTSLAADDLRRSLPVIRETLALLRELTGHLDAQPESVIYGPRQPQAKPR